MKIIKWKENHLVEKIILSNVQVYVGVEKIPQNVDDEKLKIIVEKVCMKKVSESVRSCSTLST